MKIIATVLILTSFLCAQAQDLTLKGRIISEDLEVLPEFKITDSQNNLLGVTDIEGRFEISITNEIQKLNISSLGMEHTTIELSSNCDYLEVIVMIEANYDFMSLKKVDRLRMKRYNKLPELHKEAFEKGIFKTDKACYTQTFYKYGLHLALCGSFAGREGFYYVELQLNSDSTCSLIKTFDLSKCACYGEWTINNKSIEILCNRNPETDDIARVLQGGRNIDGNIQVNVLNRNKLKIGNTILKRKN